MGGLELGLPVAFERGVLRVSRIPQDIEDGVLLLRPVAGPPGGIAMRAFGAGHGLGSAVKGEGLVRRAGPGRGARIEARRHGAGVLEERPSRTSGITVFHACISLEE